MKPLVSILIAAYNAERTIADTLKSAIGQTWPRKEVILVDDGSTDRTAEVVRQFKDVILVSTKNQGLSAAINHGFPLTQGDYIQYLDADDLLVPDKIERQLAALREFDSARLLLSLPWAPSTIEPPARFVPGTGIYYRMSGINRVSFIGNSDKKKDSLLLSMKLHIQYLRSLEDSERVRKACLAYIEVWYPISTRSVLTWCRKRRNLPPASEVDRLFLRNRGSLPGCRDFSVGR